MTKTRLPYNVVEYVCAYLKFEENRSIGAIKFYRTVTGEGLQQAKAFMDSLTEEDTKFENIMIGAYRVDPLIMSLYAFLIATKLTQFSGDTGYYTVKSSEVDRLVRQIEDRLKEEG